MATWKKVIVSGSAAELLNVTASAGLFNTSLNVGTNQQITTNPATTFLSGSFSGSFAGSFSLQNLTAGNGITAFTYNGATAQTVALDTGSAHFTAGVRGKLSAAAYLGYDSATGAFTFDSGSYGTFAAGNGLTATNGVFAVGAGTGIAVNANDVQLKNAGALTNNVLTKWDSSNGQLVDSAVTDNGLIVSISRPLSVVGAITGSAISSSGNIQGFSLNTVSNIDSVSGNITAGNGYIKAGTPAGAPDSPGAVEGALGYFTVANIGTLGVSGNATITGDLTVAGTASFNNSTSLLVADKFVLLASGSTSLTDGGIIIQNTAGGIGTAFYLEAGSAGSTGAYGRFAITGSLFAGASTATVDEYMVTVKQASGVPVAAPTFGSTGNGYGNMYIDSGNSDIYIYA
jgi:hypothetical protein